MGVVRERITQSLKDVRDLGKHLAEFNIELLKAELKRVAAKYGAAIGLFVGVAVFGFFGFCFLLATIAVALDIVLPLWAAMLVVTGMLFLLVAILSLVGRNLIMSVKNPVPEKAMAEARATADAVKRGALSVVRRRAAPPEMAAAGATAAGATAAGAAAAAADTPPSEPSGAPSSEPGGDSAT